MNGTSVCVLIMKYGLETMISQQSNFQALFFGSIYRLFAQMATAPFHSIIQTDSWPIFTVRLQNFNPLGSLAVIVGGPG